MNRETRRVARHKVRPPAGGLDYSKALPPFLDSDQLATLAHTTRRTVERWRREGSGPAYLKVGGKVLYSTETALAWLRRDERTSTSAPPSPRAA